jgi:DNA-directed RNA polymerase specialized sigma24 family protein
VPVGTVRSRLHNAMRMLRERLARDEAAPEGSRSDEI